MLVLDNLSFALLGVNGSGKSTLLKTINGILKPKESAVLVEGIALNSLSGREIAKRIGYKKQRNSLHRL